MSTAASSSAPSSALSNHDHVDTNNFFSRVQSIPLVEELTSVLHANAYSSSAISALHPVVARLPLSSTLNNLGNTALDFVESKVPALTKVDSDQVVGHAVDAVGVARSYADTYTKAVQTRVTDRLQQGSETIQSIQDRLSSVIASLPKDYASAQEVVSSLFKELDSLSAFIATQRKELPAHALHATQPIFDRLQEAFYHIKQEAAKQDVPLATKSSEILSYSQSQLSPLLADAVAALKAFTTKPAAEEQGAAAASATTTEVEVEGVAAEKKERKTKRSKAAPVAVAAATE